MGNLEIVNSTGSFVTIDAQDVERFASEIRGRVLRRNDDGYEDARTIWNAMIDKRPALVVQPTGVADVVRAVNFAREHNLLLAIQGAGHNIAGNAVCEGGLMIDLSAMRTVRVDPQARVAHVGPGATLGDIDHETQAFGLAMPTGINSTTGISGLTLGGGFGWLSRRLGMTIDQLIAADVVTVDGKLVRASQEENTDLFWAIRGGGGNFGIVTRWEFRLHPIGPDLLSGLIVLSMDDAPSALRKYGEFVKTLGDETAVWVVMRKAPPLPFLPESVHGTDVLVFALCHSGDPAQGLEAIEPLRGFGKVLGEHVGVQPFAAWQQAFDPLLTPGSRNYWKSHNFTELKPEAVDIAVDYARRLPTDQCEIFFGLIGGATQRVAPDAMAYAHRDALFVMNVHGRWENAGEDEAGIAWSRAFFNDTLPFASGGAYINFLTDDEEQRVKSAFGPSYEKLAALKKKYDPSNLLRLNQNIAPQ
jgi:FAD/FMN-containing dehydrogenase